MLVQELKDYLKITWDDEDVTLNRFLARGQKYIDGLVGSELNYEVEGEPKMLLLDYCRYAYNNASEYFEENYAGQILRLQFKTGIAQLPQDEVVE